MESPMRALLACLLALAPVVAAAAPTLGEDLEFQEARSACLDREVDELGSIEAVDRMCRDTDDIIAKARAEGICWDVGAMSWVRCD